VKKRKERKKKYTNEYQKELIGTLFLYLNFNKERYYFFERPFLPTFFGSYRNHACLYNKKEKRVKITDYYYYNPKNKNTPKRQKVFFNKSKKQNKKQYQ